MATKTAVIILCDEGVLIWAIPPLLPQPPEFFDHDPTHLPPPLFMIPFPDIFHGNPRILRKNWTTISSWYFGSSHPLYFGMLCQDSKLHIFQILLQPDLSTASLHVIYISEQTSHDLNYVFFGDYKICEDALVSCFHSNRFQYQCGVYMGLMSPPFANGISHGGSAAEISLPEIGNPRILFSCPASGRFGCLTDTNTIAVFDFF